MLVDRTALDTMQHDVIRVEHQCLSWLTKHLDLFDPSNTVTEDAESIQTTHKSLIELALLICYVDSIHPAGLAPFRNQFIEALVQFSKTNTYRYQVIRSPQLLLLYAPIATVLERLGHRDEELEFTILKVKKIGIKYIQDGYSFRQLDFLNWPLLCDSIRTERIHARDAYERTLLRAGANLFELTDADTYNITHTAFYVTDFGMRWPTWETDEAAIIRVREVINCLLCKYLSAKDFDLSAELIMSAVCMGGYSINALIEGWSILRKAQESDGMVANTATKILSNRREIWKHGYHTVVVTALAAAMTYRSLNEIDYPAASLLNLNTASTKIASKNNEKIAECQKALKLAAAHIAQNSFYHLPIERIRTITSLVYYSRICNDNELLWVKMCIEDMQLELADCDLNEYDLRFVILLDELFSRFGMRWPALESAVNSIVEGFRTVESQGIAELMPIIDDLSRYKSFPADLNIKTLLNYLHESSIRLSIEGREYDSISAIADVLPWSGVKLKNEPWAEMYYDKLTLIAMNLHKEYNIAGMATVVYILILTGYENSVITQDLIDSILSQQRQDGSFGYYKIMGNRARISNNLTAVIRMLSIYLFRCQSTNITNAIYYPED